MICKSIRRDKIPLPYNLLISHISGFSINIGQPPFLSSSFFFYFFFLSASSSHASFPGGKWKKGTDRVNHLSIIRLNICSLAWDAVSPGVLSVYPRGFQHRGLLQKGICLENRKILQISVISVTLGITESVMWCGWVEFFSLVKQQLMGKTQCYKVCILGKSEPQCQMSETLKVEAFQLIF